MNVLVYRYKIPFLISLVVGLAFVVFGDVTKWWQAVLAFLGAFAGLFVLDFEYVLFSYIVDAQDANALKIRECLRNKDIKGLIGFLNTSEYQFEELSIRSALFQILLVIFTFYTLISTIWIFAQAFVVSLLARLLYEQIMELVRTKTLKRWFWIYNGTMTQRAYFVYEVVMIVLFVLVVSFI